MKVLLVLLVLTTPLFAGDVFTPAKGDKLRTDILDAVRDPFEDHVHIKVIFRVNHLLVKDDWAFLMAEGRTKDDKPIDYTGTYFESDAKEFDEGVIALLRFKRGRWYVVTSSYFSSDVWWLGIHETYRAPKAIFPKLDLK